MTVNVLLTADSMLRTDDLVREELPRMHGRGLEQHSITVVCRYRRYKLPEVQQIRQLLVRDCACLRSTKICVRMSFEHVVKNTLDTSSTL